jgi:hypothetical protein
MGSGLMEERLKNERLQIRTTLKAMAVALAFGSALLAAEGWAQVPEKPLAATDVGAQSAPQGGGRYRGSRQLGRHSKAERRAARATAHQKRVTAAAARNAAVLPEAPDKLIAVPIAVTANEEHENR